MSCPAHDLARTRRMLVQEDVDLIREAVGCKGEQPIVADLGAGSGTSAAAVFAERPEAMVFTVDISAENLHWADKFVRGLSDVPLFWAGLKCDSTRAATFFGEAMFDVLLVDSSHEYEQTVAEIAAWLPRLKPGAAVWFHDYVGEYPGVTRAVDEAIERGDLVRIEQRGLGILTVLGPAKSAAAFFTTLREFKAEVHGVFV